MTEKNAKRRRTAPRTEIAQVRYQDVKIEYENKRTFGGPTMAQKPGLQFVIVSVGRRGRQFSYESEIFEGKTNTSRRGRFVAQSPEALSALNGMIELMWADGWNPTIFGNEWHELTFRRTVDAEGKPVASVGDD